ncbi:c-type cytochrome [Hydrogenophaga sp. PAMC20947]|uniref:c-type cytochrome n=1 Tax=Hydrogenophaga sp. PAMC20947 TaxID=2565558 RepID=UPI00109E0C75|nr:c-type cytochrome [Hydrogenophaga sp. PAMC20947]QCB46127.1 c-type cytochrome [Hydrogenophaga sp. PAMC20947]
MAQAHLKLVASISLLACCASGNALAQESPVGRLLASNCFQCHGTNGRGGEFGSIAGKSRGEIYKKLREFRAGKEGQGIMAKHANIYTDEQMRALDQWLSAQR